MGCRTEQRHLISGAVNPVMRTLFEVVLRSDFGAHYRMMVGGRPLLPFPLLQPATHPPCCDRRVAPPTGFRTCLEVRPPCIQLHAAHFAHA